MKFLIAAILALTAHQAGAATVYKCTGSDGVVIYSEASCADNAEVRTINAPAPATARAPEDVLGIEQTTSPEAKLRAVLVIFDSAAIDARDCDWALKVTKDAAKCKRAVDHVRAGSRWNAAREVYGTLLQDAEFASNRTADLSRGMKLIQEVVTAAQLLSERGR